jgi:hypothetical protein
MRLKLVCNYHIRCKLLILLGSLTLLSSCKMLPTLDADTAGSGKTYGHQKGRFHGTGGAGELILDAVGYKEGITFYDEDGDAIAAPSSLSPKNVSKSAYPGGERGVPESVRATWRIGKFHQKSNGMGWEGGTVIGDYTIPVADRIPDAVLDDIRKKGGALRIKLRLKDDGILFGWDIMRRKPIPGVDYSRCKKYECDYGLHYEMPGGDFLDTKY